MSLRWIEVSKVEPGCISVSGCCDLGSSTPVLPGCYVESLLYSLASPTRKIVGEVPAPVMEQSYYLDSAFPCCPMQFGWLHRMSGHGVVLGVLREVTAPLWFEKPEPLRGYVVEQRAMESLADLLVIRHRLRDVLEIAPLRYEVYSTKSLLLRSRSLPESEMVAAAVRTAERMGLPIQTDEKSFTKGNKPPRPRLLERMRHGMASLGTRKEETCSTSSSPR